MNLSSLSLDTAPRASAGSDAADAAAVGHTVPMLSDLVLVAMVDQLATFSTQHVHVPLHEV